MEACLEVIVDLEHEVQKQQRKEQRFRPPLYLPDRHVLSAPAFLGAVGLLRERSADVVAKAGMELQAPFLGQGLQRACARLP